MPNLTTPTQAAKPGEMMGAESKSLLRLINDHPNQTTEQPAPSQSAEAPAKAKATDTPKPATIDPEKLSPREREIAMFASITSRVAGKDVPYNGIKSQLGSTGKASLYGPNSTVR